MCSKCKYIVNKINFSAVNARRELRTNQRFCNMADVDLMYEESFSIPCVNDPTDFRIWVRSEV